ncbi:MAG: cellulase family glycosylhydrolase [Lachnospiraceae bacterium]|nr:cellulase family glycosylhydrolase [Lachnospiraceae bacterium]
MKKQKIKKRYFYAIILVFILLLVTKVGYEKLQRDMQPAVVPVATAAPAEPESISVPVATSEPEATTEPVVTPEPEPTLEPVTTVPPTVVPQETKEEIQGEEIMANALSPLHVEGTSIVNEQGEKVQLRGISTHGIAWFPQYINLDFFKQMHEEWNADVVRLAMYTAENGGYCTDGDKEATKQLIRDGVAYAEEAGMYVIVDWHILSDFNPHTNKAEAMKFFEEMSEEFADKTHVIYEICNEPNGGISWSEIKSYAEEVIGVIREKDADAIILVGTPNWSQMVDQAAKDPITDYENIMYTLHYYAGTHKESLRNTMVQAIKDGLPVFVSEYGICDASGNGALDYDQANKWVETMNSYGVSYVAWNISNKSESSAMFKAECNKISGFNEADLNPSGKWLIEMLTGEATSTLPTHEGVENPNESADRSTPTTMDNTPAPQPSPYTAPVGVTEADLNITTNNNALTVTLKTTDTWSSNGGNYYNCNITLTNTSGNDITGWEIYIDLSGKDFKLDTGWNGDYVSEGNVLKITNKDYNGTVSAGGSVGDIGFIIKM